MRTDAFRTTALAVALVLAGCAPGRRAASAGPPPRLAADELLARMHALPAVAGPQTSTGTLRLRADGYRRSARAALQLAADGRLRADLFAMGVHLFSLVAGPERFTAYRPSERKVLIGARNGGYLAQLVGADVRVDDFVRLLMPGIVFDSTDAGRLYALDIVENSYVLTCKHPDRIVRYWVDPDGYRVTRCERYGTRGGLDMSYALDGWRGWNGSAPYPARAELFAASTDVRAVLEFKDRDIGTPPDPARFSLTVPAGAETVYVDGYGG